MLNLHALRLFLKVAESGSVTLAAQELGISQPAVTSQIKKLEKELDLQLLSPMGRGVRLTEVGARLASEAGRLFSLERSIETMLEEHRLGQAGTLKIAATYLPANFLLPGPVASFKRGHPNADVAFTTTGSAQAFDLLLRYEADIAFIGGGKRLDRADLTGIPWMEDEMWFVVHREHPLADKTVPLAALAGEPFALREPGSFSREQLFSLFRLRGLPPPRVGLEMNGFSELIRVVSDGYGLAFLSALEAQEAVERGPLRRIRVEDVRLTNPISLYTRKEPLSALAARFLDMLSTAHR